MRKPNLFCFLFVYGCSLFFFPSSSSSATYFVNPDGSAQITTIQAAVNMAQDGDTIIAEPGRYRECIIIKGKRDISIKSLLVSGEKLVEIQGQGAGKGLIEVIDSDGITIQGFKLVGSRNSPKNLLYIQSSSVLIEGNWIEQARATGVYISDESNAELIRNRIYGNYTGILFYASTGKAMYNQIFSNSQNGMHITKESNVTVDHNTFYRNKETAALVEWGSIAEVFNNILVSNGTGLKGSRKVSAGHNLFYQNRQNYSGIEKTSHNVFEDPQFRDPANGDFSLMVGSPALQAGKDNLDLGAELLN